MAKRSPRRSDAEAATAPDAGGGRGGLEAADAARRRQRGKSAAQAAGRRPRGRGRGTTRQTWRGGGWNRANNRHKSGDRADKANYSYNNDGEKSHVPSLKNLPPIVAQETFFSNVQNDYNQTRLVPLEGCSSSEASQLLSDRWAAAMNLYNDQSIDSLEKPVMFSGSTGPSWGHLKLPHQMNFLEELRRAVGAQTGTARPVSSWN